MRHREVFISDSPSKRTAASSAGDYAWLAAPALLDFEALELYAECHRPAFRQAQPIPHLLWNNFIDAELALAVLAEANQESIAPGFDKIGATTRELVWELCSGSFLKVLRLLTGIGTLVPDQHLVTGGLRRPGVAPATELSDPLHPEWRLARALTLELVLAGDWAERWGGQPQLGTDSSPGPTVLCGPPLSLVVFDSQQPIGLNSSVEVAPSGTERLSLVLHYYRPAPALAKGSGDNAAR